jgi:hypothetical protein
MLLFAKKFNRLILKDICWLEGIPREGVVGWKRQILCEQWITYEDLKEGTVPTK